MCFCCDFFIVSKVTFCGISIDFTCKLVFPRGTVSNSILIFRWVGVLTLDSEWLFTLGSVVLRHSLSTVVRLVRLVFTVLFLRISLFLSSFIDQFCWIKGFDCLSTTSLESMPKNICSDWWATLILQLPNHVLPYGHPWNGISIYLGAGGGEPEQEDMSL